MRTIHAYVLLFDGFADHQVALSLAKLNTSANVHLASCGFDDRTVTAMSGLRVLPYTQCDDIDIERAGIFILPGGDLWGQPERNDPLDAVNARLVDMLESFVRARIPVAGIGSACVALARAGLLDDRHHGISRRNTIRRMAPEYIGHPFAVPAPVVNDGGIISADATAHVEFAFEILVELGVCAARHRADWLACHRHDALHLFVA